ncbi:VWA domain-containing protein, partial [Candidatus Uhrbacteria bacterium]|nr:VWA domain-containing protein [Candidatus Uhrbacteria bacterium]
YYCAWLGVCNGGDNHGDVCTLDYEDYESGDTPLEYEGYTRSAPACDGECVAPTCADNCGSSCPTSYQTTGLLVQSELAGAAKEDQVNLFSYQNSDGDSPDNAAIFVPACEAGSQIRVDIDRDDAELADIDIVFVTDLSKSMNEDPTTGSAGSSGSRNIDYVVNATKNAVADLFDAYDGGGATIRVGLVSYTSKYYSTSSSIEFCGNTLSSLTNDGAATDYALSGGTSESSIMSSLDDYKTCVSSSSGASPAQKGLETALDRFRGSTADVKIVVLLSDGGILINEDFRDAADSDGDGFANHRCEGTSESAGGSTYTGYQACVIQMADLIEDNDDVSFYSATITSSGSKMGRMAHVSSNECDWDDLQSVDDCTGDFAYAGETEEAIEEMYDDIVDSILGTTVYLTATDESGDTTTTIGGIDYGNSVELPFPDGFVCQDESQVIPLRHEFYGGAGSMSFSNFQFTYCPYVDSESSGGSGSSGSSSEEEEEEEEEEEPYCGDDTIDFTDGESCDLTSFPVGCFVASENPDDRSLEFCSATSTDDCTCSDSSAVEVSATSGARTGYCNGGSAFASDGSGTEYDYTDAVCIASGTTSTTLYGCGEDTTVSTEGTCDLVVCEDDCTIAADEPTSYTATHSTTGLACGDGYIDIAEGEYCDASDFQIYCWDSDADPSARRGYACGTTTLTDCVCDSGYAYVASSLGYCSGGSAIVGGTRYNYNGAICVNATSTRPTIHGCGEDSVSPRTREGTCVADVCDGDCTGSTFSGDDEEWGS